MKTLTIISFFLLIISMGCNSIEKDKEQKIEDSLANVQSQEAIDRANSLLNSDTIKSDTVNEKY